MHGPSDVMRRAFITCRPDNDAHGEYTLVVNIPPGKEPATVCVEEAIARKSTLVMWRIHGTSLRNVPTKAELARTRPLALDLFKIADVTEADVSIDIHIEKGE